MSLNYNPTPDPEPPSNTAFWSIVLTFLLGAVAIGGYYVYRPVPPPKPVVKERRLAPEGTFYVVQYISAHVKSGVIGFEPGTQVHLVKVLKEKRKLVVSDGSYEAEADPGQLTNDLDIAELARSQDSASQAQLARFQSLEKQRYERSIQEQNEAHEKDVGNFNQAIAANSVVGTYQNPLNKGPEATSTRVYTNGYYYSSPYSYGSPYSYFSVPYHPY